MNLPQVILIEIFGQFIYHQFGDLIVHMLSQVAQERGRGHYYQLAKLSLVSAAPQVIVDLLGKKNGLFFLDICLRLQRMMTAVTAYIPARKV